MSDKNLFINYINKIMNKASSRHAYPLSNSQRGMWSYCLKFPNSAAYNLSYIFHLKFDLDVNALNESIGSIIKKHPILNTTFFQEEGIPKQYITDRNFLALEVEDLSAQNIEFYSWKDKKNAEIASMPFNLFNDVLYRFKLVKINSNEFALFFVVHHIIFDGWSVGIFLNDLRAFYESLKNFNQIKNIKMLNTFATYCRESNKLFESGEMDDSYVYWFNRLFPAPKPVNLPYDFKRLPTSFRSGKILERVIDEELKCKIAMSAKANHCTPFIFYLSTFFVLIWRVTGSSKIMAGVAIANREESGLKDVIGPFSEVLPIVGEVFGKKTFINLLQTVKENMADDFANSRIMLDRLVQLIYPEGMPLGSDLFQLGFDYQNFPWPRDIHASTFLEQGSLAAKIDLNFSLGSFDGGMQLYLEYADDLFKESSVSSIADSYIELLQEACDKIDNQICELNWLPPDQEKKIKSWSCGKVVNFLDLLTSINKIVARYPKNNAVIMGEKSITYSELWELSGFFTVWLKNLGVKPLDIISFKLKPSIDNIALIIAIWRAGAAYHAIHIDAPIQSIERQLKTVQPVLFVVDKETVISKEVSSLAKITNLGEAQKQTKYPGKISETASGPAYVMFTTGTSGEQKPVMISHELLAPYAYGAAHDFKIRASDKVLQFAPLSFDASLEEILPALLGGAALVIKDYSMMGSVQYFLKQLSKQKITVLNLPSSFWHSLIEEWANVPTDVRMIITGGEPVSPLKLSQWLKIPQAANVRLINSYGVTEATVVSTRCDLSSFSAEDCSSWLYVPVGSPFPNCEVLVVDEILRPVPIGIFGEILIISGAPEKYFSDSESINGYCDFHGRRAFRTGDFGRFRDDGLLECKGRQDKQIKIEGFRIDLLEIELALMKIKTIREVCVINFVADNRSNRLIAHVETNGSLFDHEATRRDLRQFLAPYQIPHSFVEHEELPKSAHGKIDRIELLKIYQESLSAEIKNDKKNLPRTMLERVVVGIWKSITSVPDVDLHDDFFAVGGSSLLAIRMLSMIEKTLGTSVPLPFIFEDPTLIGLIEEIERLQVKLDLSGSELEVYKHEDSYSYKMHPYEISRFNFDNHVVAAFSPTGSFDQGAFNQSVAQVVRDVHCLRTTYSLESGYANVISADEAMLEVQSVTCNAEQINKSINDFIEQPFHVLDQQAFRTKVFYTGAENPQVILVFLEAVVDVKSVEAILGEIYNQYALITRNKLKNSVKLIKSKAFTYIQQSDYNKWLFKHFSRAESSISALQGSNKILENFNLNLDKHTAQQLEHLAVNWMTSVELILLNVWFSSLTKDPDDSVKAVAILSSRRPAPGMLSFRGAAGQFQQIPLALSNNIVSKESVHEIQKTIFKNNSPVCHVPIDQQANFTYMDYRPKKMQFNEQSAFEPQNIISSKQSSQTAMMVHWLNDHHQITVHGSAELFSSIKNYIIQLSELDPFII